MTDCPGYVNIIINDRLELEELFRYDLLISCPTNFNLTFKVPNRGQKKDKTFDIVFNDTHIEHTIFVTYLGKVEEGIWYLYSDTGSTSYIYRAVNWSVFIVIVISVIVLATTLSLVHIYLECNKLDPNSKKSTFDCLDVKHVATRCSPGKLGDASAKMCGAPSHMTWFQFAYLGVYLTFKIIYSFCFTFTIFYTIVLIVCRADIEKISTLGTVPLNVNNRSLNVSLQVENFAHQELVRQIAIFEHTLMACDLYTEDIITKTLTEIKNITMEKNRGLMYNNSENSLGYLLISRLNQWFDAYQNNVKKFENGTIKEFHNIEVLPMVQVYKKFLQQIYANDWVTYAMKLFNDSNDLNMLEKQNFDTDLAGASLEAAKYLELESVQYAEVTLLNFWER